MAVSEGSEEEFSLYLWQKAAFLESESGARAAADSLRLRLGQLEYAYYKEWVTTQVLCHDSSQPHDQALLYFLRTGGLLVVHPFISNTCWNLTSIVMEASLTTAKVSHSSMLCTHGLSFNSAFALPQA